jgi:hypothetical protein
MKESFIKILQNSFPFLLTVALWRLSVPFWNPAGILAIIPIFFCSFVKPVNWFSLFSIFMCFVIDYKFETVCFWVAIYCLFYAINSFQNIIDITRMELNGIFAFLIFFGLSILIQVFVNINFITFLRGIWMILWTSVLYIPITTLIKKVQND